MVTADDRPLEELTHAELVDRCQRLATILANNQRRLNEDLGPIIREAKADAWDEAVDEITGTYSIPIPDNPYRETDHA